MQKKEAQKVMTAIEALLIGSIIFFTVCLALMVSTCITENAARLNASNRRRAVVYDRRGATRPLYVEDLRK